MHLNCICNHFKFILLKYKCRGNQILRIRVNNLTFLKDKNGPILRIITEHINYKCTQITEVNLLQVSLDGKIKMRRQVIISFTITFHIFLILNIYQCTYVYTCVCMILYFVKRVSSGFPELLLLFRKIYKSSWLEEVRKLFSSDGNSFHFLLSQSIPNQSIRTQQKIFP